MVIGRRNTMKLVRGTVASAMLPRKLLAAPLPAATNTLALVSPPAVLPDTMFVLSNGSSHRFSEFKGRGLVVNLWATWCAPCVAEMPSLNALSKMLAPNDIAVLPLSSDRGGAEAVRAWYREHNIRDLPVVLDPGGETAHALDARGIPTTLVVDINSLIVARLEGGATWDSPETASLITRLVKS